jgi:hypothetical protein
MSRRVPSAKARKSWLSASSLSFKHTTIWLYVNLGRSLLQGLFAAAAKLAGDAALDGYHLFPTVRVDLLIKMGSSLRRVRSLSTPLIWCKTCRNENLLWP